jgi:hypothetical protein
MDGSKVAVHGSGYPLPGGYDALFGFAEASCYSEESLGAIQYFCQIIGIILILFVFHVVDVRTL